MVYENLSWWSEFPCIQDAQSENLIKCEKISLIPSKCRCAYIGLVALCLRQQLQRQRGMERGEGGCVDGEKGRGKRGGRGEKFFVNWYNQLT